MCATININTEQFVFGVKNFTTTYEIYIYDKYKN